MTPRCSGVEISSSRKMQILNRFYHSVYVTYFFKVNKTERSLVSNESADKKATKKKDGTDRLLRIM